MCCRMHLPRQKQRGISHWTRSPKRLRSACGKHKDSQEMHPVTSVSSACILPVARLGMVIDSVSSLLGDIDLSELEPLLEGEDLTSWISLDRLGLLQHLKLREIALKDRQTIVNGLAKCVEPLERLEGVACDGGVRVFVISDVHCDHEANMAWLRSHLPPRREGALDVCLCAGDVSDKTAVLTNTLQVLKERFDQVFFTPGNHDLWMSSSHLRGEESSLTSVDRLAEVMEVCKQLGVRTKPLWISAPSHRDVLIAPLFSWYHASWDQEPELDPSISPLSWETFKATWADFRRCKWPNGMQGDSLELANFFARMNEPRLSAIHSQLRPRRTIGRPPPPDALSKTETYGLYGAIPHSTGPLWTEGPGFDVNSFFTIRRKPRPTQPTSEQTYARGEDDTDSDASRPFVISLSHFAPLQELIPEKRMLVHGYLHKVSGSKPLWKQVERLEPDIHVFGHTHLNIDSTYNGIRFVQHPLGTPREQRAQTRVSSFGFMCVFDGLEGGETAEHWTYWGRHYEQYERDLTKKKLAPYVQMFYSSISLGGAHKASWGHEHALQEKLQDRRNIS